MAAPLIVPWRGRHVRIRHDDPKLEPYAPRAAVIGSAMQIASDELGLRLAIDATVGEWYRVDVAEGPTIRLRRRVPK
jgi:hypothetical protein